MSDMFAAKGCTDNGAASAAVGEPYCNVQASQAEEMGEGGGLEEIP